MRHLLIISGGESIGNTFPAMVRHLNNITDVLIISNTLDSSNKKEQIENAFHSVENFSKLAGINYLEPKYYDKENLEEITELILDIMAKYPDASKSFNVTGGSKILAIAMYRVTYLWENANAYYVSKNGEVDEIIKYRLTVKDLQKNPNYLIILQLISENDTGPGCYNKVLKKKFEEEYVRLRGNKDHPLSEGSLSALTKNLVEWGLIEKLQPDNRSNAYRLLTEGKIMLKLYRNEKLKETPSP